MGRPKKYNTSYTGDRNQMEATFQEYLSSVADCFGKPYDDREYFEDEKKRNVTSLHSVCEELDTSIPKARKRLITAGVYSTEKSRTVAELYEQRKSLIELHEKIIENGDADTALWQAVIAYQNYLFYTSSGLPFSYTVKCKRNGEHSGEMIVSRKEGSKTLTRSSVMLAFHKVLEGITTADVSNTDGTVSVVIVPLEYKGPKAIGQIFGISYVYSLFWKWGLIKVPGKVENKLRGKEK